MQTLRKHLFANEIERGSRISQYFATDQTGPVILGSARQARGMDSSNKKIEIVFAADSNCPVQAVSDPGNDRCRTRGDQFGACSCQGRSEERRVGKAGVSTCRCWWSPHNSKKNKTT